MIKLSADPNLNIPLYKQLITQIINGITDGTFRQGYLLPSMNVLADKLNISRETVKKAYGILTEQGYLTPQQGKGFYVAGNREDGKLHILVLFDQLSIYKQILYNAISQEFGDKAELTLLCFNQDINLFSYYLDSHLDHFDYYIVTPHFPLDPDSQYLAKKQVARIPNRKLLMVDHWLKDYKGRYGVVYQDFEEDVYNGLRQGLERLQQCSRLSVITSQTSLYGSWIHRGINRFVHEYRVPVRFLTEAPTSMWRNEVFLMLNAQLDWGLTDLCAKIEKSGMTLGRNVFILSYNEFGLNELILGGLSTLSTDYLYMGRETARMILGKRTGSVHCPFKLTHRFTF